jgi:2-dehydro-3-deoxy-D-arabinonate dehydratase
VPRYIRVRGPNGIEQGTVEDGRIVTGGGTEITPLDPDTMQLSEPYELLTPLAAPEIWCAGVTYERSRDARVEESAVKDVYTLVYDAPRPELFMKDAAMRRTVSPGRPIGIRTDSSWNVPEPEIGVVLGTNGHIVGYTIGNDVSSRSIEGANTLYLPQAKTYDGSCAIGPAIVPATEIEPPFTIRMTIARDGDAVYDDTTSTAQMRRSFDELASYLGRALTLPVGAFLMTGTGIVPDPSFTLQEGDVVTIAIDGLGALTNAVERLEMRD